MPREMDQRARSGYQPSRLDPRRRQTASRNASEVGYTMVLHLQDARVQGQNHFPDQKPIPLEPEAQAFEKVKPQEIVENVI